MTKEQRAAHDRLRVNVMKWAEEGAKQNIEFAGAAAFAGIPREKVDAIKHALVFYAQQGAQEAFDGLNRHGHLKI